MKSFIVAEIASNWEGNLSTAKKIIRKSKQAGADAVKFQMWRAVDLYSTKHPLWKFIKKSEITFSTASKFKKICDDIGIEFFCSAFYPEAVNFLKSINVKRYKIASRTCLLNDPFSLDTLKAKAQTGKPVIISMGMGGNKKQMEKIFSKNKPVFCYCISEYPTPLKKIDWPKAVKFDGFSDHTLGITACIAHIIPSNISQTNLNEQVFSAKPKSIISSKEFFPMISKIEDSKIEKIRFHEIKSRLYEERKANMSDYAYLIYTSGTTTKPKGVPITHSNSIFTTNNIVNILKYENSDIDVIPLPLSHSFGLGCLHASFYVGSTLILHKNLMNISEIFASIKDNSATTFAAVPSSLTKLVKDESARTKDIFKDLRLIVTNSTSIPNTTVKEFKKILRHGTIATYYGLTEASRSTFMLFDDEKKFDSVGRTPAQIEIKINNEKDLEKGEIWIKGLNVIKNYWNDLAADQNFVNGWLKTGDLGRLDKDGYLYILGRMDDIINVAGEKVLPQEVERVVKVLSDIEEAVAIPMKHESFGNTLKLFVKTTDKSKITKTEILSFCIRNLERYKVPSAIEFVEDFPKTQYGKIKRFMLK